MTTKHSSLSEIKAQADTIAAMICAAERGEPVGVQFAEKIAAARKTESFIVGIVMDDKVIRITLPWTTIKSTGEVALSEFIMREMREIRSN
jgi:hypothetical protein